MFARQSIVLTGSPIIRHYQQTRPFSLLAWFKSWTNAAQSQRLIYPPPASQFTTKNRIIDTYITQSQEIYPYLSVKQPLLLHFTYATPRHNKITQSLFDILSNKHNYPDGAEEVYLVNILCDTEGGRELMMEYVVGPTLPCIVALKNQLVYDKFVIRDIKNFNEDELVEWLRNL
ncbi:uncharacterized protein J8A68_002993 [[Candida] subhashii]|uniref:Uncharacterized protein n=1 Tax=[Candida] subhashii TaxID=561895 RepID=A0A8J5QMY4_9ASCO|nr:uncharacterized protein J8A68_002993 [[Candida] subhashii]KAG7663446.1 hypothetical protein J8A68_002993 [[Candida] subhashii]